MADDPMLALRGASRIGAGYGDAPVEQSPSGQRLDRWMAERKAALRAWLSRYAPEEDDPAFARAMREGGGGFPGEMPYVPLRELGADAYDTLLPESIGDLYLSAAPGGKGARAVAARAKALRAARAERAARALERPTMGGGRSEWADPMTPLRTRPDYLWIDERTGPFNWKR